MTKEVVEEKIATGRRKAAVASVRLRPGQGAIRVNDRKFEEYFPLEIQQKTILAPFKTLGGCQQFDMLIRVRGGGIEGQVDAVRLGIARALVQQDENLHATFKEQGFLTRDPRKRERKKYGLAGARKRFQFSKR